MVKKLIDLFRFSLNHFYPKKRNKIDNNIYPSKVEMYSEWLDSVYYNGVLYFGETNVPLIIKEVSRSFGDKLYFVEDSEELMVGFQTNDFRVSSKQSVRVAFYYGESVPYVIVTPLFKDGWVCLNDLGGIVTKDNFRSVVVSADEVVENHIKYLGVSSNEYALGNNVEYVTLNEFNRIMDE